VYGPAEVNQCTFHHLDTPPEDDAPIPIGSAWPVADLLLIDDEGTVIDDRTPGHLLVSSDTMMDRYWRRDDLTAASIATMPDPSDTDGAQRRWYRTGDRVERRANGDFVFLGRSDHQVKVRGHRIELEAVESAVVDHGAVADCAVLVERGVDGAADRLVAVVSPVVDDTVATEILRHARTRLPRAAVPSDVVGLSAIPRSGNGKIDRPAVAAAAAAAADHDFP